MGCCSSQQKKFSFPPGDEFGDTYNKYMTLHAEHLDIIQRAQKMAEKVKKDPMAAFDILGKEMENLGRTVQVEVEKEATFKILEAIYKKQKDANQLGADEKLKTQKFNELISMREKDVEKMKKQAEDMQNQLNTIKNIRI